MIRLEGITKSYPIGKEQIEVLKSINLSIEKKEFVAIMGPSGSGKSTLMNMIGCLDKPTQGSYYLDGEDVSHYKDAELAKVRNQSIGFVFQQFQLLPRLTALRNVELPMIYSGIGKKERMLRAEEALKKVGLSDRMDHLPNALSGGQKQRVAIARAIVNRPKLILADEPTGALDTKTSVSIMEEFQRLNEEGTTVVIVTHEQEIALYAKRTIYVRDGMIVSYDWEKGDRHMNFMENISMSISSLKSHKLRSLLTMLGIIIGVGAVIIVVAIGQGGEAMLKSQIIGSGNTIELYYQPSEEEMQANPNIFYETAFTQEDIRALQQISEIKQVVVTSSEFTSARFQEKTLDSAVTGINEAYLQVNELTIQKGQGFSASDFIGGRRAAIISASLNEEMFKDASPIGKIIRIGNQPVEIIGVLEKPTGLFSFASNEVYLPFNTWKMVFGKSDITQVTLQAGSADDVSAAGKKAARKLNTLHNTEDSYQVINMEEMAQGVSQITRVMTLIIGSIAGISLLVGGIGVMNIMLVSVTERTREIGIRMALGATRKQVLTQFLIESIILTLIGGIAGIFLGWGVSAIVATFAGWPPLISWQVVVGGVLFSMVIGVVFGLLPANKASKLDPIESLRYE